MFDETTGHFAAVIAATKMMTRFIYDKTSRHWLSYFGRQNLISLTRHRDICWYIWQVLDMPICVFVARKPEFYGETLRHFKPCLWLLNWCVPKSFGTSTAMFAAKKTAVFCRDIGTFTSQVCCKKKNVFKEKSGLFELWLRQQNPMFLTSYWDIFHLCLRRQNPIFMKRRQDIYCHVCVHKPGTFWTRHWDIFRPVVAIKPGVLNKTLEHFQPHYVFPTPTKCFLCA